MTNMTTEQRIAYMNKELYRIIKNYGEQATVFVDHDWDVVYGDYYKNRKQNVMGVCVYSQKKIYVSPRIKCDKIFRDVFLHECAHMLTEGHGHNTTWRAAARALGANPRATQKVEKGALEYNNTKKPKWLVVAKKDDKIEVVTTAGRKLKDLAKRMVKNDRSTLGNLWLIDAETYNKLQSDAQRMNYLVR